MYAVKPRANAMTWRCCFQNWHTESAWLVGWNTEMKIFLKYQSQTKISEENYRPICHLNKVLLNWIQRSIKQYYMCIIIKNNNTNVHEDMEKLKLSYIYFFGKQNMIKSLLNAVWQTIHSDHCRQFLWFRNSTLKWNKNYVHIKICTGMFVTALFRVDKSGYEYMK